MKIVLVGLGPGRLEDMTPAACAAIGQADVVCGYTFYIELVKKIFPEKPCHATPMRQEMERCRWAVREAAGGKNVAMVCSGDAGIYGMAGPVLEMARDASVEVEIIPGITAAVSGAALLGAPLMNDFCVISLSDYLTPWERIEKRLRSAAQGDFCIAIYNPCSKKRPDHLKKACGILLELLDPQTVCGWVRNAGRNGQETRICTLKELQDEPLDMFCTAFIGNSDTAAVNGKMITKRGYEELPFRG